MAERGSATANGLEGELRALGDELLVPMGEALPATVRARIEDLPAPSAGLRWSNHPRLPSAWSRAAVFAAVLIVVLAAATGAAVLGLPGLRIVFGPEATPIAGSPSPSAAASDADAPGTGLGLGRSIGLDAAQAVVPFAIVLPTDPRLGDPDAVWWERSLGAGQVALVWEAGPGLPAIDDAGIGAILTETPGRTDEGYVRKVIRPGGTAEPVTVGGAPGFWISGPPHEFFYETAGGEVVIDSRRVVGDTLTWWRDGILYRLESDLGRDEAIAVAESIQ